MINIRDTDWYKKMTKRMKPRDHVRNIRQAEGLTLAQLGAKVGVSALWVSDWEHGRRDMSREEIKRLAKALQVSPEVLL